MPVKYVINMDKKNPKHETQSALEGSEVHGDVIKCNI